MKKFTAHLMAVTIAAILAVSLAAPALAAASAPANLKMHVLGIGQGDGIFLELPNKQTMLVDAGNPGDGTAIVNYVKGLGYEKLDYLVATHPHADHIGGMAEVIGGISVGKFYMPDAVTNTKTFDGMLDALSAKGLQATKAAAGVNVLTDDALKLKVDIVAPAASQYDDLNNYSAVLKVSYGSTAYLLTGDAEALSEGQITADIKADVLKVGHHGSDSSTSPAFLAKVKPAYAVISVGAGNSYGHPTAATLQKLQNAGCTVYRTDLNGTVIFSSDGQKIEVSTAPALVKVNTPSPSKSEAVGDNKATEKYADPTPSSSKVTPSITPEENKQPNTQYVWITATGSKYHSIPNCGNTKTAWQIPLEDALAQGYGACKRCH